MKWIYGFVVVLGLVFQIETSFAGSLSEPEVFYRCYTHLTGKRLKRNDPLLKSVVSGKTSAVSACETVLKSAWLDSKGMINKNSDLAKSVLKNFTNLHMSFFIRRGQEGANGNEFLFGVDIYDTQTPALYYTKSLFSNQEISNILKGAEVLVGARSLGEPKGTSFSSRVPASDFKYTDTAGNKKAYTPVFVEVGELLGVKNPSRPLKTVQRYASSQDEDVLSSFGGGVLGTRHYIRDARLPVNTSTPDGANSMNRFWANNVLTDFLCKDLPAVRITDGQPYKHKDATADFRKSDGCVRCHATMDQLAAGGRHLLLTAVVDDGASRTAGEVNARYQVPRTYVINDTKTKEIWPIKSNRNYYRQSPEGALYFRSYSGDLVYSKFSNFEQLGQAIRETDDFYACIAKKYYEHFTGINVSLADIADPLTTISLTDSDRFYRNEVIRLGENLRKSQSTYGLIKEILSSQVYQDEGYLSSMGTQ